MDITSTTAPRSDQQNFDDYASGPKVVTISGVTAGSAEQPVDIHLVEFPDRPFKPSKSMRRVLVACWGAESSAYAGRQMKLYGDPTVKFGGSVVGGIRIEALSHIDKPLTVALTVSRAKRAPFTVQPLPAAADDQSGRLFALFKEKGLDKAAALHLCTQETGRTVTATKELTPAEINLVIAALSTDDES